MLVRIPFSKVSSKRHRAPNLQTITLITLNTNLNNVIEILNHYENVRHLMFVILFVLKNMYAFVES